MAFAYEPLKAAEKALFEVGIGIGGVIGFGIADDFASKLPIRISIRTAIPIPIQIHGSTSVLDTFIGLAFCQLGLW